MSALIDGYDSLAKLLNGKTGFIKKNFRSGTIPFNSRIVLVFCTLGPIFFLNPVLPLERTNESYQSCTSRYYLK